MSHITSHPHQTSQLSLVGLLTTALLHAAALCAAHVVGHANEPEGVALNEVASVVRRTFGSDIADEWNLLEVSDGKYDCPATITHTTYQRESSTGAYLLPHNTIMHGDRRCESRGLDKRLELYDSNMYDEFLNPRDEGTAPLHPDMVNMLNSTGQNVNLQFAFRNTRENYMLGFEHNQRVCSNQSVFMDGTTVFIVRPFTADFNIAKLVTRFYIGSTYLVMVPRFVNVTCVYAIRPQPIPSEEPTDESSEGPDVSTNTGDPADPPVGAAGPADEPTDQVAAQDPVASSEASSEVDGACFPADATVQLQSGRRIRLDRVRVGDYVAVGPAKFSRVFGFSHNDHSIRATFIALRTAAAATELRATSGHVVYVNGRAVRMKDARVGDSLTLADGRSSPIVSVHHLVAKGLFNAQTEHGDIVVDGVLATTYTAAVQPAFAHAALTPLRAVYRATRLDCLEFALDVCGLRGLLAHVPKPQSA